MIVRRAAVLVAAASALLAGCSTSRSGDALPTSTTPPPTSTPTSTTVSSTAGASSGCGYQGTPDDPAPAGKDVGLPTGSEPATGSVTLRSNQGDIKITLAGAAPCTVRSFTHLAGKKYFDGTP